MKFFKRHIGSILVGVILVGVLLFAFWPTPVRVETASVDRGSLSVTVDEDGRTRIRDHYVVSTPFAARVLRIDLEPGDPIRAGETLLAVLEPEDPGPLNERVHAEAMARLNAAKAARERAAANLSRVQDNYEFARRELKRAETMQKDEVISSQAYDQAELNEQTAREELRAAEFDVKIAEFELEQARAALIHTDPEKKKDSDSQRFKIRAPIDGCVLQRFQESSAVLPAGTELLELGDPRNLEIAIDVLSTDAVKIEPEAKVLIEHWGGDRPLEARVRRIEPAAFTKISVLGVEEQRVWVIADLVNSVAPPPNLGDGYRVEARIFVWEDDNVLKVPASALFRLGDDWAAFVVEDYEARRRMVEIGKNNGVEAQVLGGLEEGAEVILYPSDRIEEGTGVEVESTGN